MGIDYLIKALLRLILSDGWNERYQLGYASAIDNTFDEGSNNVHLGVQGSADYLCRDGVLANLNAIHIIVCLGL
ncbi:hypothetical protein COCHEDRAFT_1024815 [Bipolaris maydis C5]|uniref:Uncharacterized protein n=1 Tax=Cochliobolus heterostrophus (strain C5 / ATCC 48332 / race O) TaxID=701091 RepID=M2TE58_COCH5|nr:hypothetical protein COCHEDRAFT_1024815 [Bipolaris maydis C5]